MPADSFVTIDDYSAYAVWDITEPVARLRAAAGPLPAALTHLQRQRGWLAARLALRTLLAQWGMRDYALLKDVWGRPYLVTGEEVWYVSLTHSAAVACAAVCRQGPIGIDVQLPQARLLRLKTKFMNPRELLEATDDLTELCAYWCAKEAVYKAVGGQGASLQQDVCVRPSQGAFWGTVRQQLFVGHYGTVRGHVLAWCKPAPGTASAQGVGLVQ